MKQNRKHKKITSKLWRYYCKHCGSKGNLIERRYDMPTTITVCSKCGHVMVPRITSVSLNGKRKETLKIKL